jgi:hypothetical protein
LSLYVLWFQLCALLIGERDQQVSWFASLIGWNHFLFMPGLEYATAIHFFSMLLSIATWVIYCVARARRLRADQFNADCSSAAQQPAAADGMRKSAKAH